MLVVVDPHRRLVDVGLERVVGVRQIGYRVSHRMLSFSIDEVSTEPNRARYSPRPTPSARGTASGLPPVHSLNRYQEGFASRCLVSRPAEVQKMQVPPSSVQVNHQTPPTRQRPRLRGEQFEDFESCFGLAEEAALPAGRAARRSPSRARSRRSASAASPLRPHDPPQVGQLRAHRLRRRRRRGAGRRRRSTASRCRLRRGGRGSRRRRRWAGSAAAGRRGRRRSLSTAGSAPCRIAPGDPDQRREARPGSGSLAKVTMFSSFQISQWWIGRKGEFRVLFPEFAFRPVACDRGAQERGPAAALPEPCGPAGPRVSAATHSGVPETNGITRDAASAASSTSWSKPLQFRSRGERPVRLDRGPVRAAASRCRSPPSRISSKSEALAGFCGEMPMNPCGR